VETIRQFLCVSLFLSAFIPFQLCAAEEAINDGQIVSAIKTQLMHDNLPFKAVGVRSHDGNVTLSGTVADLPDRDRIRSAAERTRGVRSVADRITVVPAQVPDRDIYRQIQKNILNTAASDPSALNASVENGVVTIAGSVPTYQEKELIIQMARHTRGVREVTDQLRISPPAHPPSNEKLLFDIRCRLQADVWVEDKFITVGVNNGSAVLSGTVGTVAAKNHAFADALAAGATSVDVSELNVEWQVSDEMYRRRKNDFEIAQIVRECIAADPRAAVAGLQVDVNAGIITLQGSTKNLKARNAAADIAIRTAGAQVVNLIEVSNRKERSDDAIARDISNALRSNPDIKAGRRIKVSVSHGTATLSGTVPSLLEKAQAVYTASQVEGIKKVENCIEAELGFKGCKSDGEIKKYIESRLRHDTSAGAGNVKICVEKGIVTLNGTVNTWSEKSALLDIAFDGGACFIVDNIRTEEVSDD